MLCLTIAYIARGHMATPPSLARREQEYGVSRLNSITVAGQYELVFFHGLPFRESVQTRFIHVKSSHVTRCNL